MEYDGNEILITRKNQGRIFIRMPFFESAPFDPASNFFGIWKMLAETTSKGLEKSPIEFMARNNRDDFGVLRRVDIAYQPK
jgi:hypothetical protein